MNYFIITYGCQMNKSDSERIATIMEKIGFQKALKMEEADLAVVNMCSVRQSAVDRIYGLRPKFAKLKTINPKLKTILTGCILKKDRKKFAQYFDYILSTKDLPRWKKILLKRLTIVSDLSKFNEYEYLKIHPEYSTFPVGYVPISTGCNNSCSYCVVPYTRGPEVCRPVNDILSEVRNLIKKGFKEIWLLGQNVNSYKSEAINFSKLLRIVNEIPGNFWIRFTSSHPKDFSDELIETMADCQKVTPYLNLPVQSGDNEILRRMNRNYTAKHYKSLVKKIRQKIPDVTLSTDIIVGFPGETKKQFENTVKLFKGVKFDMAYIAQYSPRPNTAAAQLKDNVPKEEKRKREKILTEVLKNGVLEKNKKFIGKTLEILPTKKKNEFLIGKSFHYKTIRFKGDKNFIGKFIRVKIIAAEPWGLKGVITKKAANIFLFSRQN